MIQTVIEKSNNESKKRKVDDGDAMIKINQQIQEIKNNIKDIDNKLNSNSLTDDERSDLKDDLIRNKSILGKLIKNLNDFL
jgi:hypothetical protein